MTATELVLEARNQRASNGGVRLTDYAQVAQALMILLDLVLASIDYDLKPNQTPTVVARALSLAIADLEAFEGPVQPPLRIA
jgi:hypothetical protein